MGINEFYKDVVEGYRALARSADPYADYLKGAKEYIGKGFMKALSDIGRTQQAIRTGQNVPEALMNDPMVNAMGGMMGQISKLYHGSPAKFTKFDDEKIGTGEGAQVFGYGHYLTESPEVAKTYARPGIEIDGKRVEDVIPDNIFDKPQDAFNLRRSLTNALTQNPDKTPKQLAKEARLLSKRYGYELEKTKDKHWKNEYQSSINNLNRVADALEGKYGEVSRISNIYTATINKGKPSSADVFLEWDKPVPEGLTEKIKQLLPERVRDRYDVKGRNGMDLVNRLMIDVGDVESSKILSQLGITGIKYPTGTLSGIKGSDKYNYVVFDPKNITIDKINDIPIQGR